MAVDGINGVNGVGSGDHAHRETARPLDIAVVGAGIGGLTAAVGLRRSGHNVTVGLRSVIQAKCIVG
jgi:ketol-acid reductoisomerase